MDRRQLCVYILASQRNGTIYIGITCDLVKRIWQYKNDVARFYQPISRAYAGLVRTASDDGVGDTSGESAQEVEAGLEDAVD
jgi:predicted GIY-YIG superfamily endonuclease